MNFIAKIRSCFWQDDLGAPSGGQNSGGVVVRESGSRENAEEIDSLEQERKIEELKEGVIEMMIPVNMMNKAFWSFLDELVKAAEEFNIEYSLVDNIAYCEGKAKDVEKFETLLEKIHRLTIKGKIKRNINLREDDDDGDNDDFPIKRNNWDDRNFVIPLDLTREDMDVVLYKAKKKELKFRFKYNVLKVRGNKFELSRFSEWLEEFTKIRKKQKQDFKEFLENLRLETITEKIQILPFDDGQKLDIQKKASILKVKCIFDEDNSQTLEISGTVEKVKGFKSYIQAINPMFPKNLYPKYWDFSIEDAYAEIEVEATSKEFKEMKSKVYGSFAPASLTKLKRIQNQGLLNNYLTMICSGTKKKKREGRRVLFYGTETQEPEKIYKHSKIGFDLSYASFKGRFGRGLYFPITAFYAHGSAYKSSPMTFQILVADVFVGDALKSSQSFQNNPLKGYDSLLDQNNYVIYKNSQSYPLYLVEYTFELESTPFVEELKVKAYKDDYEDDYEVVEIGEGKIADLRFAENFECPVELSPPAWDALKMQIEMLNLALVETNGSTIRVSGIESNMEAFSQWLNEFFSDLIIGESNLEEILEKKIEKIAYSMLYHVRIDEIMRKATELEVDYLLSKTLDQMSLTGLPKNLESFKAYLHNISFQAKKYMFPKYWDFSIIEPYVEIEVIFGSEEFKEISKIFNYGFKNAQISRLTRIQNYDLFNNYITTVCSRTEVGPEKNLQRKLLFHGTKRSNPRSIFNNSEIGFDLQYARTNGKYGKGIYFSTNSSYSHLYAHSSGTGTYIMLIADVYTGVSFTKWKNTIFNQLTEDQDSLFADEDNFFVLYKNFQSYPLYLVEYTHSGPLYPYSRIKQKHMVNILKGGQYCLVDYPGAQLDQKLDIMCLHRVEKEYQKIRNDEFLLENFLVDRVEKSGSVEWLVSFKGFKDTPYEGGLFKIKVIFPSTYPIEPLFMKFLTPVYHPSINEQGIPCLGLLSKWSAATEIGHVLLTISCLLHDPLMEDPVMSDRIALFKSNKNEYLKVAQDWTRKYAH